MPPTRKVYSKMYYAEGKIKYHLIFAAFLYKAISIKKPSLKNTVSCKCKSSQ